MIFEGAISVKAILENKKRNINCLYVVEKKNDRNTRYILSLADKRNIPVKTISKEEIDSLAVGHTHGGLLIDADNRKYESIKGILDKENFVCIIDGIEDPFNIGYAMRSLYAYGATAIIINNHSLSNMESQILKSSAGSYEHLKVVNSKNLVADIKYLKSKKLTIYALNRSDISCSLENVKLEDNLAFIIGGEKRGISKLIRAEIDQEVYLEYDNEFRNALNASSALSIFAFYRHLKNK